MFLSPLIVGLVAGGRITVVSSYLVVAATAGFLLRQPLTTLARVRSGRRPSSDIPAARFWIVAYGTIGGVHILGLVSRGHGNLLYLALPAVPVLVWHLLLVRRRAEHRQLTLEVLAAGVLALSAPACMWIGLVHAAPLGWALWLLAWAGSANALIYTVLRLEQNHWRAPRDLGARLRAGSGALSSASAGLAVALALGLAQLTPFWLLLPFAVLLGESLIGTLKPAAELRPKHIGVRQVVMSTIFTLLLAWAWTQPVASP